jgi:hypothetical protein
VLLLLSLHAAQSGPNHFHRPARAERPSSARGVASAGRSDDAGYARDGAGHAQCLLCRLQRDLSSSLRGSAPAEPEAPQPSRPGEAVASAAHQGTPAGVSRGRAPPRA